MAKIVFTNRYFVWRTALTLLATLIVTGRGNTQNHTESDGTVVEPEFEGLLECPQGSDEEINECLASLLKDIRPFLAKGIPSIGIPVLEPLLLDELKFEGLGLRYTWRNVTIHGFSRFDNFDAQVQSKRKTIDFTHHYPYVRLDTEYFREGSSWNLFPGSGNLQVELYDFRANGTMFMDIVRDKSGKRAWQVTDVDYASSLGGVRVDIPSWAQTVVGRWWLDIVNNNAQWLYNVFEPIITLGFRRYLRRYFNGRKLYWVPTVFPLPPESIENRWG